MHLDDYEPYMDEGFEIESALGSAGMGTDEYYRPAEDLDSWLTETDLPEREVE